MTNLKISIDEVVDLKVLIVIAPRVEQGFSNLDPSKVSNELDDGEDGNEDDGGVADEGSGDANLDSQAIEGGHVHAGGVASRLQVLVSEQVGEEVGVNGDGDHLGVCWN